MNIEKIDFNFKHFIGTLSLLQMFDSIKASDQIESIEKNYVTNIFVTSRENYILK